jgi:hypothetical protein
VSILLTRFTNILKKAGMDPGKFYTKEMRCTDFVREKKAHCKAKDEIKVHRKILRSRGGINIVTKPRKKKELHMPQGHFDHSNTSIY